MTKKSVPPLNLRQLLDGAVLTLMAIVFASTWHLRTFVVSGPSMAETLLGQHHQLTCGACGCVFRCDAEKPEMPGKRALCPNCGDATRRLDTAPRLPADAIVVDRTAFCVRPPRRWELAAFRGADRASQVYVKRVTGLPGETIELKNGDVYADGVIQQKNMVQLRATAVLVHDSRCGPASVPSRWLSDVAGSGWRQAGSRFWRAATKDASGDETIDWLMYHHRRGTGASDMTHAPQKGTGPFFHRGGAPRGNGIEKMDLSPFDESPIRDDCGYNQTNPVTESHLVRDLLVRCHIRTDDSSAVSWLITDGVSQFLVELDFSIRTAAVTQDGRRLGESDCSSGIAKSVLCELSLCDQQVLLALDEREVLRMTYEPPNLPFRPTSRPVAVGTRGAGLEIWDLTLWRDIYYSSTGHGKGPLQDRLGEDEYFVLGDNSLDSLDSRNWSPPGVAAARLIGKPIVAWPSSMRARERGGQFQVPAVSRLRYIH